MLENITQKLGGIFNSLMGKPKITGNNIQEAIIELKTALLDADVNLKVASKFTEEVLRDAIGQKVIENVKPQDYAFGTHKIKCHLYSDKNSNKR